MNTVVSYYNDILLDYGHFDRTQYKYTLNGASVTVDVTVVGPLAFVTLTCVGNMSKYEWETPKNFFPYPPLDHSAFAIGRSFSAASYTTEYGTTQYEIRTDGIIHVTTRELGTVVRSASTMYVYKTLEHLG